MQQYIVLILVLALVASFYTEHGVADGVCGANSSLIWVKLSLSGGNGSISVTGTAIDAFSNCLKTLYYTEEKIHHEGIAPRLSDTFKAAPFPGTWERCKDIARAYPRETHNTYYLAFWWGTRDLDDALCHDH